VQRALAVIAIFAGWLSIPVGVVFGLISSDFLGLSHVFDSIERGAPTVPPPSASIYGVDGLLALWVFGVAAMLLPIPLAVTLRAPDPRPRLRLLAVAMALIGVVLIPDPLGRAFGLPIVAGAVCFWAGAEVVYREAVARGLTTSDGPTPALAVGADAAGADAAGSSDATAPAGPVPATPQPAKAARREAKAPKHVCPWCSAPIRTHTGSCPSCHATLNAPAAESIHIPGLTEVPPELLKYAEDSHAGKKRTSLRSALFGGSDIPVDPNPEPPSDAAALQPPSPALIAEMARLDAEIAAEAVSLHGAAGGDTDSAAAALAAPARPSRQRRGSTRT
jgi:hypothetical protein